MTAATASPLTRDEVATWARDLYASAVDRKDAAGFAAVFTPDAWLRFGNNPPLEGPAAIREAIAGFFQAFVSLSHEEKGTFLDGQTLFLEAVVTYTRHDGNTVSVPAMTVFHLVGKRDGRLMADNCRIFVDLAPLFAP
ncbi:MAG TPA: nuclear transport factor 2 family protein [Gemmatimonadaceae bacterium]|nr:nuclear transport factor 2 family protein [Gemmatimonadaceae bacterium]